MCLGLDEPDLRGWGWLSGRQAGAAAPDRLCSALAGAGRAAAGLGDHAGLGGELGPVEDGPLPDPADGGHGDHGARAVPAPHKAGQRVQGVRRQTASRRDGPAGRGPWRGPDDSHFAQDRNWEVIEATRSKIEQFKRTMPLISDLRNPALRER